MLSETSPCVSNGEKFLKSSKMSKNVEKIRVLSQRVLLQEIKDKQNVRLEKEFGVIKFHRKTLLL